MLMSVTRGEGHQEESMSDEMVLLRVMAGAWEGWRWMHFEEFLQQLDLASWRDDEMLVGMVLPPPGRRPAPDEQP